MAKGDEKKLSKFILSILKDKIEKKFKSISFEERIKVISDLTCIQEKEHAFHFDLGFSEVDLAIFKKIEFENKIGFIKSSNTLDGMFKTVMNKKDTKTLNVPFIIIELKSGDITTDAIRSRRVVAQSIKNIFPFCLYIFIGENTKKTQETLRRQGKDFDAYFIYEKKISKKDIIDIYEKFILQYLEKNLKND